MMAAGGTLTQYEAEARRSTNDPRVACRYTAWLDLTTTEWRP